MNVRRLLVFAIVLLGVTGCPRTRSGLAKVPPVPLGGSAEARARFLESQSRYEKTKHDLTGEFETLAAQYPDDPVAPYALLYAGMSAVRAGNYQAGLESLTELDRRPVDAALRGRGDLYRGIALGYLRRYDEALGALIAAERAVDRKDRREYGEWLAAMAEAHSGSGKPGKAIRYYDAWFDIATQAERTYIIGRVRELVGQLEPAQVVDVYSKLDRQNGPGAALLGTRLAAELATRGDIDQADRIRREIEGARQAIGEVVDARESRAGNPGLLGALLPLSGRRNRVGDRSMRGLSMAANVFAPGTPFGRRPLRLSVQDVASAGRDLGRVIHELAEENAIAVVGPLDGGVTRLAAEEAGKRGLPLISLSPRGGGQSGASQYVFHAVHSAESRARALARYAIKQRVRDFAILAPTNAYGRAVGGAFQREVERLGGRIAVTSSYAATATSFVDAVAALNKPWRAVFVPDQARRLALVAPALAAANFLARPAGMKSTGGPRHVLLLSTADLVDERYLRSAGRYSYGAVFAPGFFADKKDPVIGDFVADYFAQFGALPTALEAYAHDAVLAVSGAIQAGAEDRGELAGALEKSAVRGLTGTIRFDRVHQRGDDGILYRVEKLTSGDYELRAMR